MMLRRYEKVKSLKVFIITGLGSFRTPAAKFNDRPHLSATRLHTERDDSVALFAKSSLVDNSCSLSLGCRRIPQVSFRVRLITQNSYLGNTRAFCAATFSCFNSPSVD